MLAFAITGGFEIGPVSVREAHKPLFIFVILSTVRLGIGGPFEVAALARRRMKPRTTPLAALAVPHALADAAFALLVTRAAIVAVGFLANLLFPAARARPFPIPFDQDRFVETFAAWDSGWYLDIAMRGYFFDAARESSVAFFPLYPLLMRVLAWPFGGTYASVWIAGLVVSWSAFALALVALHRFSERLTGDRAIARPAPAALTPLPLALAGYCTFVYSLSGDALAWFRAQDQWGYRLGQPPWRELLNLTERLVEHGLYDYFLLSERAPFDLLHGASALFVLALTPAVFRRLGAPLGAYVLVSLLIPLSANVLEGVGRYASVLFPVFIVMGHVTSRRLHDAIVIVGSLFLALFTTLFVNQYPVY
jgi:hypothetical protein